ncbi:MAG: hypothetical protein ACI8W8_003489 [Rhodothermales bacterium]|jgi:hypothetical protein
MYPNIEHQGIVCLSTLPDTHTELVIPSDSNVRQINAVIHVRITPLSPDQSNYFVTKLSNSQ